MDDINDFLKRGGITPTPIRKLVYRCLLNTHLPLSLSDLEVALDSVDKSTISRTLSVFKDHHLIHSFTDGSGSVKYELCKSSDHAEEDDTHVHFRCEKCGITFCLPHLRIPKVELPLGFEPHGVSYIVSGICQKCVN